MAEIRIEGKVAAAFGDHLYLVFVNDSGQEFVIRGGPANDNFLDFGNIVTELGVPIAASEDNRPVEDRADFGSQVLDLGGRDAEDVWKVMLQAAQLIDAAGIDYDFLGPNSNSTVASVLHTVGIDANTVEPNVPGINFFPGISDDLLDEYARVFTADHTTDGNDILRGGNLNDSFEGGGGNDNIDAGDGNGDVAIFSGDCSEYDVSKADDGTVTVAHVRGAMSDGTDTLTNVEIARFADGEFDLTGDLEVRQPLDLMLLIDVSGSMGDDIASVRNRAGEIVDAVFQNCADARVGIISFNDTNEIRTELSFTDQETFEERKTAAIAGIQGVNIVGGGLEPTYEAMLSAMNGNAGAFRLDEAVTRRIVVFTDEPPADPELRPQVIQRANDLGISIQPQALSASLSLTTLSLASTEAEFTPTVEIFTVFIGGNSAARQEYDDLAEATGGQVFSAANASEVVAALIDAIESPGGNTPPVAQNDVFGVDEDNLLTGNVLEDNGNGADSDPDGDPLTVSLVSGPSEGILTLNDNGSFSYEADADVFDLAAPGTVIEQSFTYQIDDGNGEVDQGTATISVTILDDGEMFVGGNGRQTLTGTDGGEDLLLGENGDDELYGLDGADTLKGGRGDDLLFGGEGPDFLFGGRGDDLLNGGLGDDELTGGKGDDTFVFALSEGTDTVLDYGVGEDLIGLDGLTFNDISIGQAGDDATISANGELLAVLTGVEAASLSESDFFSFV